MFDIVVKGILIGILVSAPMGPIGVLCVQRTLNEGRTHGFISGLGATFSDLLYAIITGLGISFILDFIQANHYPLQIVGSILLMGAGYYIYRSNPARTLKKQCKEKSTAIWQNFISSFFINLANIGILFFFIAMFARFNFIDPIDSTKNFVGILSIGLGTVIWWLGVSTVVDKVRNIFNPRGLKIFNNILGVILFIIGVVGLLTSTVSLIELYA
ncbi:LysE family translocator [Dysgonomonas macrotermitis]|uniref:Threonine/homoserine/homoserine lactone efflux protein n=1 Tax=Dysgonomonas macrotermitis TaxID=1346286 RepID=A0A1M5G0K9_9BACT|nr:LysE family transporter [Dysgonomonas macrotermitis]SHF97249.1 Threonine/homoserine/homoserine lactone efflux protein [Dysgonomonas macrotermitis]